MSLLAFLGAETGGLEELSTSGGSISVTSTTPRSGTYAYLLTGAVATTGIFTVTVAAARVAGFGFYWNVNVIPTSDINIFAIDTNAVVLRIKAVNGNLQVIDANGSVAGTITAPFAQNTQYYVEVLAANSNSGAIEVWINGTQSFATSTGDSSQGSEYANVTFTGSAVVGEDIRIDDIYFDSATATRYGPSAVYAYQAGNTTATSDVGNNLDTGAWNNAGRTPLETASTRISLTGSPDNGSVYYNDAASGGRGPGPSGGAYTVDGTIRGGKWIWQVFRGTGAGSTHFGKIGNNTDGVTNTAAWGLSTSPEIRTALTDSAAIVPTASEVFAQGFATSGAQDVLCDEMWAMLLHTPASTPQQKNWIRTGNVQNMYGVRPGRLFGRSW